MLEVKGLTVTVPGPDGGLPAVRGVDFALAAGGTLALVGESGSGKTLTALALLGLLPPGARASGSVRWQGRELLGLPEAERRALRGRRLALVFQEPGTALNPVLRVGEQVAEALRHHHGLGRREAAARAEALLREVRLPDPAARAREYPHQLSGGMRQRVVLAAALACEPALLIADEPTTALDVTVQAQILDLLADLVRTRGMALLLVTHDLALVPTLARRIVVLCGGLAVEAGETADVLRAPAHPYTRALVAALPEAWPGGRLPAVAGGPADLRVPLAGCPYAPRCPHAAPACRAERPPFVPLAAGRVAACLPEVARGLAAEPLAWEPEAWS